MSDDENSQADIPQEPPKEDPGKKFFISHLNSYTGKALLKELRNEHLVREAYAAHIFNGTFKQDEPDFARLKDHIPEGVQQILSMDRTKEFRDNILNSDVIIYDLMTNQYEEVDYVIKTLKTSNLTQEKTLILLSSVMTWVNTPAKEKKENVEGDDDEEAQGEQEQEEEEEEQDEDAPLDENGEPIKQKKILFFKESDYHLRVPAPRFQHLKTLETLAMSSVNTQPKLKVHVLCSGIRYGNGEETFYELFKQAWLQNPQELPYTGKGDNLIPTIHVIDLARLVRRVVSKEKYNHPYIFAIDRTKKPTQKRIIEAISKGIGTGKVLQSEENNGKEWQEFLNINLKMKASDAFKDEEPPEGQEEEDEEAAKNLKFPWHCENGIVDNALKLNIEFNDFRGLHPVKIFITGPPASGKSFYAQILAQYYNIPRVHIQEIVDRAFEMAKIEEGDELIEEIKAKIEELRDAMVAQIEESRAEDQEPEEIDREKLPIRLPDELLYKILRIRLNENACRNRGYILDGYPRTFKDAQYVFLVKQKKINEDGEEVDEDDEEQEEGEEKNFDKYIPNQAIFPSSVIVFQGDDEFLMNRVKELPEAKIDGTHYSNDDMIRRLKIYRTANNSQIAEPSVQEFFKQKGVQIFEIESNLPSQKVISSLKIYIERIEKPFNYMTYDAQEEAQRQIQNAYQIQNEEYTEEQKIQREEALEKELRKQKEAYTKQRFDQIKEHERDMLDSKSQPIRQYLMDNLVPILTDGLIEVCKKTPQDPVDFLAEYLFRRSLDVPYPDPTTY